MSATSRAPGAYVFLPKLSGSVRLVVMCHDWSGIIRIAQGDDIVEVDLYSPVHEIREIPVFGDGIRDVMISVTANKNPRSHDTQVWLHGLWIEKRQTWLDPVARLTPALQVVNGDFGIFMTIARDVGISHSIKTYGAWGADQVDLFKALARPGSTVIDVGANIGHHSVILSDLVGPTGRVLAFEPQPFVYSVLQSNLALNGCTNAVAHRCALGSVVGAATMEPMDYESDAWNVGGLGISSNPATTAPTAQVVDVRLLDEFTGDFDVDFIKCDAQGYDFEVIKGAVALIDRCKPIVLFEVAPLAMLGGVETYKLMYAFFQERGYLLLDPNNPDPSAPARQWAGVPEEWDVLAVQPHHLDRLQGR